MHATTTTLRRTPFGKRFRWTATLTCSCGWSHVSTAPLSLRARLADSMDMLAHNHKWAAANLPTDTRAPASVMDHLGFLR